MKKFKHSQIAFSKFHGTGNDFILIDNREQQVKLHQHGISEMCDRRFGIGADGLILLENDIDFDFRMIYFNADGKEGSMCGNGGRCVVAFADQLGIVSKQTTFTAIDGMHEASLTRSNNNEWNVKLKMSDVNAISNALKSDHYTDTGSPHIVRQLSSLDDLDVVNEGREIRNSESYYKEGVNVNFIAIINDVIMIRTYERGVENETYSCGTGSVAAALVAGKDKPDGEHISTLRSLGGDLKVYFTKVNGSYTNIFLEGSAKYVFEGTINLD